MNKQSSKQVNQLDEDAALVELTSVLPAVDRLRFAALGRINLLGTAKEKSLLREEKARVTRLGAAAPDVARVRRRLEMQKLFNGAITVEAQRTQATTTVRDPEVLTLHGRVVTVTRSPLPDLTVSATDETGKSTAYVASDENGYFALSVPASSDTAGQFVTLLVSDRKKNVYFQGTECFERVPGRVIYRELVVATTDPKQPPTPPPEVDPKSITVPSVVGLREDLAVAQIQAVGLSPSTTTKPADAESAGRVIDQSPKAGTKVAPCSEVSIIVGEAPPSVTVPNVLGQTLAEAKAALDKVDLATGTVTPEGASDAAVVAQQTPTAGTSVPPASVVNLVLREPSTGVTVPNVVESDLTAARKAITAAKLRVRNIEPPNAAPTSVVIDQAPEAGKQVRAGTPVDLKVRIEEDTVTVPNVVRMQLDGAAATLEKAHLKVGKTKPADAPATSTVIAQSPPSGTSAKPGTSINLELRIPGTGIPIAETPARPVMAKKRTAATRKARTSPAKATTRKKQPKK